MTRAQELTELRESIAALARTVAQATNGPTTGPTARPSKNVNGAEDASPEEAQQLLDTLWNSVTFSVSSKNAVPFVELPIKYGVALNILDAVALCTYAGRWAAHILENIDKFTVTACSRIVNGKRVKVSASDIRAYARAKAKALAK